MTSILLLPMALLPPTPVALPASAQSPAGSRFRGVFPLNSSRATSCPVNYRISPIKVIGTKRFLCGLGPENEMGGLLRPFRHRRRSRHRLMLHTSTSRFWRLPVPGPAFHPISPSSPGPGPGAIFARGKKGVTEAVLKYGCAWSAAVWESPWIVPPDRIEKVADAAPQLSTE